MLDLTAQQITSIRAILATKKGAVSKSKDYTLGDIRTLLNGEKLKPLHIGRPMNKLGLCAIEVLEIIGFKAVLIGDMNEWIAMRCNDVYYSLNLTESVSFGVKDILDACSITYDADWLNSQLWQISELEDLIE